MTDTVTEFMTADDQAEPSLETAAVEQKLVDELVERLMDRADASEAALLGEGGLLLPVGAARELFEETDVKVDPDRLQLVHPVHHHQEDGSERIGFFFVATEWEGRPMNKEPNKCLALQRAVTGMVHRDRKAARGTSARATAGITGACRKR
ncbi:NUDIX domain-containing protein, partial [Streptomyces sp. NPDC002523]